MSTLRYFVRPTWPLLRFTSLSRQLSPRYLFQQITRAEERVQAPCLLQVGLRFESHKATKYEDYSSESGSDDDEHPEVQGESPFWRQKMATIHRILDVNKDGVISFDDFLLLTEKFTDLGHLSKRHHDEFQKLIQEAWEQQRGAVDKYNLVTMEQFLQDMHHVVNDPKQRKKVHKYLPYFFKAVDKDKSGQITVDEFKLFFKCLGLTDEDATISFTTIDINKDGRLSLKEFLKLGREYLLTEDERKPSKYFWGPLADH